MTKKELFENIKEREDNTTRPVLPTKNLEFKVENGIFAIDGVKNTPIKVGSSAWNSIFNKIDLKGSGLNYLPDELVCELINKILKNKKEKVKLITIDETVAAVLDESYVEIPIASSFPVVDEVLDREIEGLEYLSGQTDIVSSTMYYTVKSKSQTLNRMYRPGKSETFIPIIKVESSDIGERALSFTPGFLDKSNNIRFLQNEGSRFVHRGEKEDLTSLIKKSIPSLFERLQVNMQNMERLDSYKIKNADLVFESIKDKFVLISAKDLSNLKTLWTAMVETETLESMLETGIEPVFTAFDLLRIIQDYASRIPDESIAKRNAWENNIIPKLYAANFADFDAD